MLAEIATSTGMLPTRGLVMINFTARWCGPCRVMKPVLSALSVEYGKHVQFVEVDVDDEPVIAQQYNVRSMPTYIALRDGREVGRFVGSRPRSFVAGVLDRIIGGDVAVAAP
jgi:thioredoxin 1